MWMSLCICVYVCVLYCHGCVCMMSTVFAMRSNSFSKIYQTVSAQVCVSQEGQCIVQFVVRVLDRRSFLLNKIFVCLELMRVKCIVSRYRPCITHPFGFTFSTNSFSDFVNRVPFILAIEHRARKVSHVSTFSGFKWSRPAFFFTLLIAGIASSGNAMDSP